MKSAHRVLDPAMPRTELNGVCALAVMTKAPRPGQVKTRLTPPLSPPESYRRAANVLAAEGERVVLGPSDDGGYYLIGLKKLHQRLFEQIDWSTAHVLKQTIERASELKLPVEFLPSGYDVDDAETLRR